MGNLGSCCTKPVSAVSMTRNDRARTTIRIMGLAVSNDERAWLKLTFLGFCGGSPMAEDTKKVAMETPGLNQCRLIAGLRGNVTT